MRRIMLLLLAAATTYAQIAAPTATQGSSAAQLPLSGRNASGGSVNAVQSPTSGATATVNTLNPTVQVQGNYSGSTPQVGPQPSMALGIREAIRRGLEFNLGTIGFTNAIRQAKGQATVSRSALLPNISSNLRETLQKTNLAALGVRSPLFPTIVGPFNYFDLRATLTQSLFDFTSRNNYKAAKENVAAMEFLMTDARDIVVFAVSGSYLQAVAAEARVDVAKAQLETARTLLDQATQFNREGLIAAVDVNRSRVEMQAEQQRLIALENDVAKQKLNLARMIGLSPGQPFTLADSIPFHPSDMSTPDEALKTALATRADLRAAEAQVRAAERVRSAARAERLPSLSVSADYGVIGVNPAQASPTFNITGNLRIPIWQGGRTAGSIEQAEAALEQRRSELADLRGRIEQEIRNALLDLESSASQVKVAESSVQVARQNLDLTRQRFEGGVADTAEVVRAQESVHVAEQDVITGAFSHNLAKAALAKATGRAEAALVQMLGVP